MTKRARTSLGPTVAQQERAHKRIHKRFVKAKKPNLTPEQQRALALRDSARRLVIVIEEAVSAGAVRLPYSGLLEAIVDLKRALQR
jgi:hypothetical protein